MRLCRIATTNSLLCVLKLIERIVKYLIYNKIFFSSWPNTKIPKPLSLRSGAYLFEKIVIYSSRDSRDNKSFNNYIFLNSSSLFPHLSYFSSYILVKNLCVPNREFLCLCQLLVILFACGKGRRIHVSSTSFFIFCIKFSAFYFLKTPKDTLTREIIYFDVWLLNKLKIYFLFLHIFVLILFRTFPCCSSLNFLFQSTRIH